MWITPVSIKPTVTFDILEKLDIRVGTIERVEDVSGSDKLVRLIVDFGDHQRTILAGMKRSAPTRAKSRASRPCSSSTWNRKMMGELSEGILFDIGYGDGITQ